MKISEQLNTRTSRDIEYDSKRLHSCPKQEECNKNISLLFYFLHIPTQTYVHLSQTTNNKNAYTNEKKNQVRLYALIKHQPHTHIRRRLLVLIAHTIDKNNNTFNNYVQLGDKLNISRP